MIIENGFIQTKTTTGGGNLHGVPQPVTESWSDPIPCNIKENRDDHKGQYVDGKFTKYAATILIEPQDFTAKRIKITDNREQELGEFEVQSVKYLHAVEALQITVSNAS